MSAARQFLVCDSIEHAALVDMVVCEFFRDEDGNKGSQWSGVYAKPGLFSDTYAVAWEDQLRSVFGDDPSIGIVTEEDGDDWQELPAQE